MSTKFIICCDCGKHINIQRVLNIGDDYTDIICDTCLKQQFGEESYNFWKKFIDTQPERSKREDSNDGDAVL